MPDVSGYLSAHIDRDANDHCGNGDAGNKCNAHRSSHQGAELPQNLLLSAPGLFSPEGAARWTETRTKKGFLREKLKGNPKPKHKKSL